MNSLKRIFLYCRMLVAEVPWTSYTWAPAILIGFTVFATVVTGDSNSVDSFLKKGFSIWESGSMAGLIVSAGWIGGIGLSAAFGSVQFKEEDRTVRTLSIPLSNGERFAASLAIHFLYVPLLAVGIPLLLTLITSPFLSEFVMIPPARYYLYALGVGWMAHIVTAALWLYPGYAYQKKGGWVVAISIGLIITYLSFTSVPNSYNFAHEVVTAPDVYGMDVHTKFNKPEGIYEIEVEYEEQDNLFNRVFDELSLNLLLTLIILTAMISAAGIALTKKTA